MYAEKLTHHFTHQSSPLPSASPLSRGDFSLHRPLAGEIFPSPWEGKVSEQRIVLCSRARPGIHAPPRAEIQLRVRPGIQVHVVSVEPPPAYNPCPLICGQQPVRVALYKIGSRSEPYPSLSPYLFPLSPVFSATACVQSLPAHLQAKGPIKKSAASKF